MKIELELSDDQFQVLHRAIVRFNIYVTDQHDSASQDIEFKLYRKGAAENFYKLMLNSEIILDKLAECVNDSKA